MSEDEDRAVTDTGGIECRDCGATFEHSGRGRPPVRCPDCRAIGKSKPAVGGAKESAPKRPAGIAQLQSNLQMQLTLLGAGMAIVDPFDAKVIVSKAEKGAKVLANLAATNPKIKELLERGVETAGYGPVLLWVAEVTLPILAHHGLLRGVPDPARKPGSGTPNVNGFISEFSVPQDVPV